MSGSTSVYPLAHAAGEGLPEAPSPKSVRFRILQGGSDIGDQRRRPRPRHDRQRLARPAPLRPRRPAVQPHRARRRLRRHPPRQPDRQPVAGADPGDLLRPRPQLERRARRAARAARSTSSSGPPPPVRRTRSRTSSWAARAAPRIAGSAQPAVVERPRAERGALEQSAIGYVDFRFTSGTNAVSYRGVGVQPAQRAGRHLRRRPQLLDGHARRAERRDRAVHQVRALVQGPADRRQELGAAPLGPRGRHRSPHRSRALTPPVARPPRRAPARRGRPARSCVFVAGMLVFVFGERVAVVPRERARLVRQPARRRDRRPAARRDLPGARRPAALELRAGRVAAAVGHAPDDGRRGASSASSSRRSRRCSSSSSRRRGSSACCGRSSRCWPACRRSSTA